MITDKKIAVIGHTKGLGKLVFENLQELGNDVSGFSKSLGYDISDAEDRQSIVKKSSECDVIINNAYNFDAWDDAQMHMLMDLYGRHYSDWNNVNNFCLDKQICNIKFGPIKSGLTLNQAGLDNAFDPEVMYNAMLFIMDNYFNRDGLFVYNLELS